MKIQNVLFIFIAILFLVALFQLLMMGLRPPETLATISQNNTRVKIVQLDRVGTPYTFTVTGEGGEENVVSIKPGEISMASATCPDQICVRQGPITDGTVPIVCLPNRVIIHIGSTPSDLADAATGG